MLCHLHTGAELSLNASPPKAASLWWQELHERYYEPLAAVQPSLQAILQGPPVKKLLFMTHPDIVTSQIIPYWQVRPHNEHPLSPSV